MKYLIFYSYATTPPVISLPEQRNDNNSIPLSGTLTHSRQNCIHTLFRCALWPQVLNQLIVRITKKNICTYNKKIYVRITKKIPIVIPIRSQPISVGPVQVIQREVASPVPAAHVVAAPLPRHQAEVGLDYYVVVVFHCTIVLCEDNTDKWNENI